MNPLSTKARNILGEILSHLPAILWRLTVITFLLIPVYITQLARGIQLAFPDAATKLSKSPFLTWLGKWQETKDLQAAHAYAMGFLALTFFGWEAVLRLAFGDDSWFRKFPKVETAKKIVMTIVVTVMVVDAWFLYCGIINRSWGGATFSFSAVFIVVGYLALNVGVSLVSVYLSPRKETPKEGQL